jgi:hypothetical protein
MTIGRSFVPALDLTIVPQRLLRAFINSRSRRAPSFVLISSAFLCSSARCSSSSSFLFSLARLVSFLGLSLASSVEHAFLLREVPLVPASPAACCDPSLDSILFCAILSLAATLATDLDFRVSVSTEQSLGVVLRPRLEAMVCRGSIFSWSSVVDSTPDPEEVSGGSCASSSSSNAARIRASRSATSDAVSSASASFALQIGPFLLATSWSSVVDSTPHLEEVCGVDCASSSASNAACIWAARSSTSCAVSSGSTSSGLQIGQFFRVEKVGGTWFTDA